MIATTRCKGGREQVREYLIEAREKAGLTQQDVANRIGISRQYYQMVETGERQKRMDLSLAGGLSVVLNTVMKKNFPGGHITIVGANSPSSLASRPIKVLLADEIDRYPKSAGTEGDPLDLAKKRQTTFWDYKTVMVSTPTIKGDSRIEDAYLLSTQEEWNVPCPECGAYQPFLWENVKFDKDDLDKGIGYVCRECGCVSNELHTMAAPLPFGGCALRTPTITTTSGTSTPMAPTATTGATTPMMFAPLSFFPLHSWSLTMARSVSTLHLPSARTAQLWGRRTRPLRGSTPSGMPTATP